MWQKMEYLEKTLNAKAFFTISMVRVTTYTIDHFFTNEKFEELTH